MRATARGDAGRARGIGQAGGGRGVLAGAVVSSPTDRGASSSVMRQETKGTAKGREEASVIE